MPKKFRFMFLFLLNACILAVLVGAAAGDSGGKGRSVTVRFPAFSINPGDRISGVKLKTSLGRINTGCVPNRWTCDRTETAVHCYTLHPTFALGISGMLPEMIIHHLPEDGGSPSLDATVEFIDGSGKEYSKDIRQDELTIK